MRKILLAVTLAVSCASAAAAQESPLVGDYRLSEGPDAAGGLRIAADGHFQYGLTVGAMDERAEGRWEARGDAICLFTEPTPVPPAFAKAAPVEVDGAVPTIFVSWPNGRGVAGVDFVIGFDQGDPIEDYTQVYGWTMPEGDTRVPRWVELNEPIYNIAAPRFELVEADKGKLHARLVPNDFGVAVFDGACFQARDKAFILTRPEGEMRFQRESGGGDFSMKPGRTPSL